MSQKMSPPVIPEECVQVVDVDDACPDLPLVEGTGSALAVIWPGVGARQRSMHLFSLDAEARTVQMEHPSEATYYVIEGAAVAADSSDGSVQQADTGAMIFIEPHTPYSIAAHEGPVRFVGGPCPPDPALYVGMPDV